jgi:hypothetical protein
VSSQRRGCYRNLVEEFPQQKANVWHSITRALQFFQFDEHQRAGRQGRV